MSDEPMSGPVAVARCPWCSAALASADVPTCPSCGATLQGESEAQVPGLTAIDPMAVIEAGREARRPRNRLVSWLTGGEEESSAPRSAAPEAIAPPSLEVRREMLRMRMAAELEALSSEAQAMAIEEALAAELRGDHAAAAASAAAGAGAATGSEATSDAAEGAPGASEDAPRTSTGADPAPPTSEHTSG